MFFSIRVFFHRHWQFTGQKRIGRNHLLFHSATSTHWRTLRHLFATLHVRWLSRIFYHNVCVYQTATRWDLPPYQITIWLIDWWCNVSFLTWRIDSTFLLQRFAVENRWIWNRIKYHPFITSGPTKPFPNSPPFPNTVSEAVRGYLLLTVQCLRDLRDAMPRHCSSSVSHPTLA